MKSQASIAAICLSILLSASASAAALRPRQNLNASSTLSSSAATPSASGNASATAIVDPTIEDPDWVFPEAFDTILSTNFTSVSCPSFFTQVLSAPEFTECRPFSLLLSSSNQFFKAQKKVDTLPYVLRETCYVPPHCSDTMAALVTRIQGSDACQDDLKQGNALATMALTGFKNYNLMREAGCAKNQETGAYCFAEAAVSKTPDKSYFYYLPSGTSLPSGTRTDCEDVCTKQLMEIYSNYATDPTLDISKTYSQGQTVANRECGPEFARVASQKSSAYTDRATLSILFGLMLWSLFMGF